MKRIKWLLLLPVVVLTGCYTTPEGGQIVVIRNGGPFDNKNIRQVVCPGAARESTGVQSEEHPYPADTQQRLYKFGEMKDADAGPVTVRTKDGVNAQIEGTFYLKTRFNCSKEGQRLLKEFDNSFGTRQFGTSSGEDGTKPWEKGGWSTFLNSIVQPVLDSNFREVIAEFDCKQLVSSCALLARDGGSTEPADENNKSNIKQIEDRINQNVVVQLEARLNERYFGDIAFNLQKVTLPEVDDAIASAQKAFAKVADVRAERLRQQEQVKVEEQKRQVAAARARGYTACDSCARQDELKAFGESLPDSITHLFFDKMPVAIGK